MRVVTFRARPTLVAAVPRVHAINKFVYLSCMYAFIRIIDFWQQPGNPGPSVYPLSKRRSEERGDDKNTCISGRGGGGHIKNSKVDFPVNVCVQYSPITFCGNR